MSAATLLSSLRSLGVEVTADDGRLRVSAARGQLTGELRAAIAAQKAELLALLASEGDDPPLEIPRVPRGGPLPLSLFQERLWLQSRFQPESTAYNMLATWVSHGPVDVPRVADAIAAVARRHEILRACFREDGGVPFVELLPTEAVQVELRDLGGGSAEDHRARIVADGEKAKHTPFDLRAEPPARFTVYRAAGDRAVTLVSAHHIAMDAWSFALLGREIMAAYEGRAPSTSGAALQYVDFAAWQRRALDDRTIARELAWWKQRLSRCPRTSTLPPDRPPSRRPEGETRSFRFDRGLSDGIRALARRERATVYMALLAACSTVLHWYTGQEDIVLGSPMGLRERPELEDVLGPFVSLLAIRLDLSGDPTFAELLARVRSAVLDAHEHRRAPFEKVVEQVNPERSLDRAPLFQVAVVLHNAGGEAPSIESGGALFDLTWFIRETEGSFAGGLEYRSDRYRRETIDEVAARLEAVLRRAVEDPRLRLHEVGRLDPSEARPAKGGPESTPAGSFEGADVLELPADRPRVPGRSGARAIERVSLPSDAFSAARAAGATSFEVALSAFEILLYRYTGQTDVTVGVLLPGDRAGGAPGGELPVRVQLLPDAPFTSLVDAVRAATRAARGRADGVEALAPASARRRGELQAPPAVRFAFGGALHAGGPAAPDGAPELSFALVEDERGPAASIEFDAGIFDAPTIRRLADHYRSILRAVAADPRLHVSRVPLLSAAERHEVLGRMRATCGAARATTPVIRLFEEQARRVPEAIAVVDGLATLSYRTLDRAAAALARRLRAAGAAPGERVAVSLERSHAVVVALLAILKTGAAYVPVDPSYPPERSGYVLEDAAPVVLLTEEDVRARTPVPPRVAVVTIVPGELTSELADAPELSDADPEAIAYVLYTSGSTGRPKGVEVPNRALTNFLASMQRTPGILPEDRLLSVTTISFDIAGLEVFLPLVTGASVEIVPREVVADGARLAEQIERSGATLMQATPSTWKMLVEARWRGNGALKLLCGGEPMSRELADQLLERAGSVWNMYGPTETTIWSTVHRVAPGEGPVPVGVPVDNTPVYVLDPHGEIVPYGVAGEIYIGGAGVADGYLRRPELTASRFVADPYAGGDARMYRTGDAGRLRPDGTLECLGRLDSQVKIRGHRIELGEIESVLREHPLVADVVVDAREFASGDLRLVAYYVPRDAGVAARELRELSRRKLAKDMVPAAWVALAAIPLTPNGKIDRRALLPPDAGALADDDVERVGPRDALEAELTEIWESVLGAKVTSVRDGFFDLGGHSLLATRLFARIERATGVPLPLATLLEKGTIEHLAATVRERLAAGRERVASERGFEFLVGIRARGSRSPLFCVHGAGGNVLNLHDVAKHTSPDRPFYGIQAAGVDGRTPPMQTIEEMAERYLEEVRALQPRGPYYLSGYCGGGIVAYEIAQRLRGAGEEVALLALIDSYRPGFIVPESRGRRWARAVLEDNARALLRKARRKLVNDLGVTVRALRVRYHLSRGDQIPYDLRDYWLVVCFLEALERYSLRPYAGKVTVFRAREVDAWLGDPGPDLGWAPLALDGIVAHEVPGNHHSLTREPNVRVLAAQLEASLQQAESADRRPSRPETARSPGGALG